MSGSKISIVLAATALLVSVLFATPLGQAAGRMILPKNSVGAAQLKKNAVGSKKIAKNAVTSAKVQDGSLMTADFKAGQLPAGPKGDPGQRGPTGPRGIQGIQGIQGLPGTARAYGRVGKFGGLWASASKNVTGVTMPINGKGLYCIALAPGIDASKTGLIAVPAAIEDDTVFTVNQGAQTIVEWYGAAPDCPAGQMEVWTGRRVQSSAGSPDGDIHQIVNQWVPEGFFFVVP